MKRNTIIIITVLAIIVTGVVVAVMMGGYSSPAPANNSSTNTSNSADVAATITFTNSGFSPASLSIKKGETVKVVNDASTALQFSSDEHPTHTDDPELNMRVLQPGEEATVTVNNVGTWGIHDHLNVSRTAQITVTE